MRPEIGKTYRLDSMLLRCKKFNGNIGVFNEVNRNGTVKVHTK